MQSLANIEPMSKPSADATITTTANPNDAVVTGPVSSDGPKILIATPLNKNTNDLTKQQALLDEMKDASAMAGLMYDEYIHAIDRPIDGINDRRVTQEGFENSLGMNRCRLASIGAAEAVVKPVKCRSRSHKSDETWTTDRYAD
ncbi:hypothetical protein MBLNU459_g8454t1 [Dothideomycetes sp. NU459]